jgi:hypothetical protein
MTVQKHQADAEPVEFWERDIRCRIQVGGHMDCTAHGNSISFVLAVTCEAVMAAHHAGLFQDKEIHTVDVDLSYWHLTDDLKELEIKAGYAGIPKKRQSFNACLNHTVDQAKAEFMKALALAQIQLTGSGGEIPTEEGN